MTALRVSISADNTVQTSRAPGRAAPGLCCCPLRHSAIQGGLFAYSTDFQGLVTSWIVS
jgi:hypothetical protein